ncbi:MAG: hypothetical protein A2V67_13700 [Deltaproteobacteria bacterium RBG_13_61_14]|nr:MAG: hypothetical protein A2V67_13700 [Deltaproteobacteria bacterium RBG_13_61_14]
MSSLTPIFPAVLPVFLLIGLGLLLRRVGFFTAASVEALSRLVFYVAVPCLLFDSIAKSELGQAFDSIVILSAWSLVAATAGALYLAGRSLAPELRGTFVQGVFRSNLAFVGLPLCEGAYGKEALAPAAIFLGLMVPIFNFFAVLVLLLPHHSGNSRQGLGTLGRSLALNPFIIGSGLGIVASAGQLQLPVALGTSVEWVGRIALPLALLALGGSLEFRRLQARTGLIALASALKLVLYPALFLGILVFFHRSGLLLKVPVILLATPTAVVSFITAREMKGSEDLAGGIVMATTLASAVSLPVWLWVLELF